LEAFHGDLLSMSLPQHNTGWKNQQTGVVGSAQVTGSGLTHEVKTELVTVSFKLRCTHQTEKSKESDIGTHLTAGPLPTVSNVKTVGRVLEAMACE
jgi:hypothetical protein